MKNSPHALPDTLARLIAGGVWPGPGGPSMNAQLFAPLVAPERVRMFAEGESLICLEQPPFRTIADHFCDGRPGDFWSQHGALHQIAPEQTLIIGDFGLGSDSPIVLDFRRNASDPPVLWLRWGDRAQGNEWIQGAGNFESFAKRIGLIADP